MTSVQFYDFLNSCNGKIREEISRLNQAIDVLVNISQALEKSMEKIGG
jgi:ABC-type transporter Mla subunit MlaD